MKTIIVKNKITGEEKEIQIPDGFEYYETITCDKYFKDYDGSYEIRGFYIGQGTANKLHDYTINTPFNRDVFVTKELAESAIALAQLSQIIEHNSYLKSLLINKSQIFSNIDNIDNISDIVVITYYYFDGTISYSYLDNYDTLHKLVKKMKAIDYVLNNNYLVFKINDKRDCDKIRDFIKDNEDLIKKYLMV